MGDLIVEGWTPPPLNGYDGDIVIADQPLECLLEAAARQPTVSQCMQVARVPVIGELQHETGIPGGFDDHFVQAGDRVHGIPGALVLQLGQIEAGLDEYGPRVVAIRFEGAPRYQRGRRQNGA